MKYAIALALAIATLGFMPHADARVPHRPCKYEDSINCVWDARHMGNGIGHSFWTGKHGKVHYISHRRAHHLIFG